MPKKRYFCASNSADGFVNYFDDFSAFPRSRRRYVIKGGPGTGKSRFMGDIALEAESGGARVEYYYCSSDPQSLDGIFLSFEGGKTVSMIDGTSPHSAEATCPGAVDELIDLGAFWDSDMLASNGEKIISLAQSKTRAAAEGYSCLAAAGALRRAGAALLRPITDLAGVAARAERAARLFAPTRGIRSPLNAVGMRGKVEFDTFAEQAMQLIFVEDGTRCGTEHFFFDALCRALEGRVRYAPDAVVPEHIRAITDGNVAAVEGERASREPVMRVDTAAFIDAKGLANRSSRLREIEKAADAAERCAVTSFAQMSQAHFELEKIYSAAMDFKRKEKFTREFASRLLALCAEDAE